jgi:hypothetical protein
VIAARRVDRLALGIGFTCFVAGAGCDATRTSIGAWLPEASTGFYLEAETAMLSGGFSIGNDASASGGRFVEPPVGITSPDEPGAARARFEFDVDVRGAYVIWGRIFSPDVRHNTFWLKLDDGKWFVWRMTTGEVWYWAPLHENANYGTPLRFDFEIGSHELVVANATEGNRIDRLYFTADGDTPPGNDTRCDPPHSVLISGSCIPSCGSQGGNRCGVTACQGQPTLPAYDCEICCITP